MSKLFGSVRSAKFARNFGHAGRWEFDGRYEQRRANFIQTTGLGHPAKNRAKLLRSAMDHCSPNWKMANDSGGSVVVNWVLEEAVTGAWTGLMAVGLVGVLSALPAIKVDV